MPQPKGQGASQANPIDPETGLPTVLTNVSPAQGVALAQAAATAVAPNPRAVLGTNRNTALNRGNASLGTPEGPEAV